MKKVSVTLDEEVARWALRRAAELGTTLSRMVEEMLREQMREDSDYEAAMRSHLGSPAAPLRDN